MNDTSSDATPSDTTNVTRYEPGPCASDGVHENTPAADTAAPSGPAPNDHVNPFTGTSGSTATAVNPHATPSTTVTSATGSATGPTFTSSTATVIVSESARLGTPSSVTTTSKAYSPGPCASDGVHENTPPGVIDAPDGAPTSENTRPATAESGSRAVAVKVISVSSAPD